MFSMNKISPDIHSINLKQVMTDLKCDITEKTKMTSDKKPIGEAKLDVKCVKSFGS